MKKIILSLIFVLATISLNAQDNTTEQNVSQVPAEEATTGVAKAMIDEVEVEIGWVQLWRGGPKFANRNVGATESTDKESSKGTPVNYNEAAKVGDDFVWGANWAAPAKDVMLLLATDGKVTHTYCQQDDVWGFLFTGKGKYKSNSIFIPSDNGDDSIGNVYMWSSTADGSTAWDLCMDHSFGHCYCIWYADRQNVAYYVRPVLVE